MTWPLISQAYTFYDTRDAHYEIHSELTRYTKFRSVYKQINIAESYNFIKCTNSVYCYCRYSRLGGPHEYTRNLSLDIKRMTFIAVEFVVVFARIQTKRKMKNTHENTVCNCMYYHLVCDRELIFTVICMQHSPIFHIKICPVPSSCLLHVFCFSGSLKSFSLKHAFEYA